MKSISALSSLNTSIQLAPNPDILLNNLSITEATDSSAIENIVTTSDEIYKALSLDKNISPETKEILNYKKALWKGIEDIKTKTLRTNTFIEIADTINGSNQGIRKLSGTALRNGLNQIIYSPPEGEDVIRHLLGNLEEFIHSEDELHPLIKMGIIHYQYEAIHPFYDGNGRSGRVLNILYLLEKKQMDHPSLFLSRYILKNRNDYYEGFTKVREKNDWKNWTLYMLKGIEETARYSLQQVIEINQLKETTIKFLRQLIKREINVEKFAHALFLQPYCRPVNLLNDKIKDRKTSLSYLSKLENLGFLKKENTKHGVVFRNKGLINVLRREDLDSEIKKLFENHSIPIPFSLKGRKG
ncbi:MAG: Fic family protein [Flavobacteriaceae bacterium]|nr:Fic family protein [Flavobacteriaceae bacterium]